LFIVTTNRVLSYRVSGKRTGSPAIVIDEIDSRLGCATLDWKRKNMVVARDEAIYLCGIEGRGNCYAYEGTHHFSLAFKELLITFFKQGVNPASTHIQITLSLSRHRFFLRLLRRRRLSEIYLLARPTQQSRTSRKFDSENKLVAYIGTFKQGVREVISQWGNIYVLSTDGNVSYN